MAFCNFSLRRSEGLGPPQVVLFGLAFAVVVIPPESYGGSQSAANLFIMNSKRFDFWLFWGSICFFYLSRTLWIPWYGMGPEKANKAMVQKESSQNSSKPDDESAKSKIRAVAWWCFLMRFDNAARPQSFLLKKRLIKKHPIKLVSTKEKSNNWKEFVWLRWSFRKRSNSSLIAF